MGAMVATRRKPKTVTVTDPDAPMSMLQAAKLAGVSKTLMRDRRPDLLAAGAVQMNATRWEVTPRHMEKAGIIKILPPKPEADPLEAAQAAREAARREQAERDARAAQRAEVARESPTREESAGTPAREAERLANVADPYAARVRQSAEHSRTAAESAAAAAYVAALDGKGAPAASDTAVTIAELRHAAELADARHAAELAEERRKTAVAEAQARAWQERSGTMELLAKERGETIAMLRAMLGGSAPLGRVLGS